MTVWNWKLYFSEKKSSAKCKNLTRNNLCVHIIGDSPCWTSQFHLVEAEENAHTHIHAKRNFSLQNREKSLRYFTVIRYPSKIMKYEIIQKSRETNGWSSWNFQFSCVEENKENNSYEKSFKKNVHRLL